MTGRQTIIEMKRNRLYEEYEYYQKAHKDILTGKQVMSYGIGSRNTSRYPLNLETILKRLNEIEQELLALESPSRRRIERVVPMDW